MTRTELQQRIVQKLEAMEPNKLAFLDSIIDGLNFYIQPQNFNFVSAKNNNEKDDGFWDMTLKFRERMRQENIVFEDADFADLRDRSVGREVEF